MTRITNRTMGWLLWIAGLLCALIQGRLRGQVVFQPMYGVRPPPQAYRPVVGADQMKQAAALVERYLAPVVAVEPAPEVQARVEALIEQLGSQRYRQRQSAWAAIVALGPASLRALSAAADSGDLEVAHRARSAMAAIRKGARRPAADALVKLGYAAYIAVAQRTAATQSELAVASRAAFEADRKGDARGLAAARAAKAAAEARLSLLMRLSGRIGVVGLPIDPNLPQPKYGMAVRYGIRPLIAPAPVQQLR